MARMRTVAVVVLVLVLGSVLAAVSSWRRTRFAERSAESRRFVSRRVVDRDARDQQALERWGNDGGAMEGGRDATVR